MHYHQEEGVPLLAVKQPAKRQEIVEEPKQQPPEQTPTEEPHEIIHKIQIDDSLEGLSLQYGVSTGRIKQRNNLQGNDIYYLKELVIPDPTSNVQGMHIDPAELLRLKQEYAISGFMAELQKEDRSYKVARYYLEMADWDIYRAVAQYREELEWQRNQGKQPKGGSAVLEEYKRQVDRTLNLKKARPAAQYRNIELTEKKSK